MPTSRLEIDLSAIERNINALRAALRTVPAQRSPGSLLCAVLKQDAYAMGASRIARWLSAREVDMAAVYSPREAGVLADNAATMPVLVLLPVREIRRTGPLYSLAVAGRLHLTVHDDDQLDALLRAIDGLGLRLPLHAFVDTGMSRGGCIPELAAPLITRILNAPRARLAGVMTHFASPEDPDRVAEQLRLLDSALAPLRGALPAGTPVHAADSAATFRFPDSHLAMVRIGQALFGFSTDAPHESLRHAHGQLERAVRWTSSIAHVSDVPAGWPVGYDATWRAPRPSRIAVVPVGYADGYPRAASGSAHVRITGERWDDPARAPAARAHTRACFAPVVGRVSMDQITIDVTDAPPELAAVGAQVEITGRDADAPNDLAALARAAGTVVHELLCGMSHRLPRSYTCDATDTNTPDRSSTHPPRPGVLARLPAPRDAAAPGR